MDQLIDRIGDNRIGVTESVQQLRCPARSLADHPLQRPDDQAVPTEAQCLRASVNRLQKGGRHVDGRRHEYIHEYTDTRPGWQVPVPQEARETQWDVRAAAAAGLRPGGGL